MQEREIKLLFDVLVHVPDMYDRSERVGNKEIHFITEMNDISKTIRYGEVLSTPEYFNTNLQKGDIIYFHHNIVRRTSNNEGEYMHGPFEVDRMRGLYNCPLEEIYGVERNGVFMTLDPFCFIKPVQNRIVKNEGKILTVEQFTEKPNIGIIRYGNSQLRDLGFNEGDQVVFKVDSEYEFKVYGEKLYRMNTNKILSHWYGS